MNRYLTGETSRWTAIYPARLLPIVRRRRIARTHERVFVAANHLATRLARSSPWTFRFGARHSGSVLKLVGPMRAVVMIERAYYEVPAYRHFIDARGGLPIRPRRESAEQWVQRLPVTNKREYIDRYPIADRCWDGRLPLRGVEIDESAGSSGKPYQWVRSAGELEEIHRTLELLAGYLIDAGPEARTELPLVTINAFSMGAWSTGVNVSASLKRLGTVKSCGPEIDKILDCFKLFGSNVRYALCGYPPFLEVVADAAAAADIDLKAYNITGFVGGEGMGEGLRSRLLASYTDVWSAYGASDLDIGVASETPVAVWLRQAAAECPDLAQELFGTTSRLPMCFQYDPATYHVEMVTSEFGVELVATVLRPTLSPRLRYAVGDAGGVIDLAAALAAAGRHGYVVSGHGGIDPSWGAPFDLPLLYVHGRADSTVSYMGANLYPEDVEAGIDDARDELASRGVRVGAFCMELVGDENAHPRINVELTDAGPARALDTEIEAILLAALRCRLLRNNADYRAALAEDPRAGVLDIQLHPAGEGPFAVNSTRIKRRYIVSQEQTS